MTTRACWGVCLIVAACGGSSAPAPIGARIGPALAAALDAAETVREPWRCAAGDLAQLKDEQLVQGKHTWRIAGHAMRLDGKGPVSIGVIADAGGATPPTLGALGRLRTQLATADLVISLGGMGTTQAELEATLGTLSERSPWPIVALAGDLESETAHHAAIAALRARGHAVFDGRLVRRLELPGATIATIPGAGAMARLVAASEGCGYTAADVAAVFTELTAAPGLRVVASSEAPRVMVNGEPAGERALTPGPPQQIDVVLYGPPGSAESPPRAGARDGAAIALTPGTSDASTRLPGPRHPPSAGLLTVTGNSWRWKPIVDPN
ncbi:MAG: hypothetical protein H6Q90_5407 [Deltaproteobacteria bacterium]|nr:hypothetical protein [Deltaproteobacteria bacterium]